MIHMSHMHVEEGIEKSTSKKNGTLTFYYFMLVHKQHSFKSNNIEKEHQIYSNNIFLTL
jgi:hypothetical protein